MKAWCGSRVDPRRQPCGRAVRSPILALPIHRIAVDMPIPNRTAACRADIPSEDAFKTRDRRSSLNALAIIHLHQGRLWIRRRAHSHFTSDSSIGGRALEQWAATDGIAWHDFVRAVKTVWRDHQFACLSSRGGEGLPRTSLEAVSCGRAILTTDVPGCRYFVPDEIECCVVKPNDAGDLAQALIQLSHNAAKVRSIGAAARKHILQGYTEADTIASVADMYAQTFSTFQTAR